MGETETNTKKKKPSPLWILFPVAALLILTGIWLLRDGFSDETESAAPVVTVAPAVTPRPPESTPAPALTASEGYMRCPDGLFYPERGLTRAEAAEILNAAGAALPADEGSVVLTEETLLALAAEAADARAAEDAMISIRGLGDETVTRAEAAVFFNRLFGLSPSGEERAFFPDAAPDYWAWSEIQTAGESGFSWTGENGRPEPGFHLIDGYLYLAGEDGFFLKNQYVGSLLFSDTGRYTSGSLELDDYVAEMLRSVTTPDMTREEMLRAAYEYCRDTFTYLVRHYYNIGDEGWALNEALTMYSTGKGNCYCYASAFWAAARQLGYDAKIVSGTYGVDLAPHGWVEIWAEDGKRRTYDVEVEMVLHRRGAKRESLYAMTDSQRRNHNYVETLNKDNIVPRETNDGLLYR